MIALLGRCDEQVTRFIMANANDPQKMGAYLCTKQALTNGTAVAIFALVLLAAVLVIYRAYRYCERDRHG